MKAYIKSAKTFRTVLQGDELNHDLFTDALDRQKSTVSMSDEIPGSMARNWLVLNGDLYWIDTVSPGKGSTKLSLLPPEELFSRQLIYSEGCDTVGEFLLQVITDQWINQQDPVYAVPYLTAVNYDTTPFIAPEPDDNGVYVLLDYLHAVRRSHNIRLHWSIRGGRLLAEIRRDPVKTHALIVRDGHTVLESSAFAGSDLAKITAIQRVDTGEKDEDGEKIYSHTMEDWYLSADGSISKTAPANRAEGKWIILPVSENNEIEEAVAAKFAADSASHKIELRTDAQMAAGDHFRIRISGELFEGAVDSVRHKSGDVRPLYTSGNLATTLTDKVRALGERSKLI